MPRKKQTKTLSKPNKRSKSKFPGLDPSVNGKKRQEVMDQDYIDKLSEKEKQWLSDFNEHWLSGSTKKGSKKFGKTVKERKAAYNRNNARNRCQLSIAKATGFAVSTEDVKEQVETISGKNPDSTENEVIEILDAKISGERGEE